MEEFYKSEHLHDRQFFVSREGRRDVDDARVHRRNSDSICGIAKVGKPGGQTVYADSSSGSMRLIILQWTLATSFLYNSLD
jgi:hypothetical protein